MTDKTLDEYFADWEGDALGFGYGSGEPHTIPALQSFMAAIPVREEGVTTYDYRVLEQAVGPGVAWFILNLFGHADVIEYGSSPRFGWLTSHGHALKSYFDSRTVDEILSALGGDSTGRCLRMHCNCATPCSNPFWPKRNAA